MFELIVCCQLIFAAKHILSQAERSLEYKTCWGNFEVAFKGAV